MDLENLSIDLFVNNDLFCHITNLEHQLVHLFVV